MGQTNGADLNPENADEEIVFAFDNVQMNGVTSISFDIYVKSANNPVRFAGGDVYIKYSTALFGDFLVGSSNITLTKGEVVEDATYALSMVDNNEETMLISIGTNCREPEKMFELSDDYEKLCHVVANMDDINAVGSLSMDAFEMSGNVKYYDPEKGCVPFERVTTPNPIPDFLAPVITSHDTIATAGTGFIMNIKGTGFGSEKGEVWFKNADKADGSFVKSYPPDIITWDSNFINVRVPSAAKTVLGSGQAPAGSGLFQIRTSTSIGATSPKKVDILYAVLDFRNGSDRELRVYMGENDLGDGNKDGILTFKLDSTLYYNLDAKASVETALCDWTQKTGVQWKSGGLSPKTSYADNDSTNLIYLSNQFSGSTANFTAYTQITGSRTDVCQNSPNVRFLREVDIGIRKDLSTINPPAPGYYYGTTGSPGANMDFYSVVLHELGHAHLLKHVIPDTKIMYHFLSAGMTRRTVTANDASGGIDVLDSSAVRLGLYPNCAMAIQKGTNCITVSLDETLAQRGIMVYPNPATDQIFVKIPPTKNFKLVLYNILGQRVIAKYFENSGGQITIDIPADVLPGIYYLSLEADGRMQSCTILKN